MFWTDWGTDMPKIERCGMDGDPSSRVVLEDTGLKWPNALTLDHVDRRLYWTEAAENDHQIWGMNWSGSGRRNHRIPVRPASVSSGRSSVYGHDGLGAQRSQFRTRRC